MPSVRTYLRTAVVAVTLLSAVHAGTNPCATGWSWYDDTTGSPANQEGQDSCLQIFTTTGSWTAANSSCASKGAQLLSIESTQGRSTNNLYSFVYTMMTGRYLGEGEDLWVCHAPG